MPHATRRRIALVAAAAGTVFTVVLGVPTDAMASATTCNGIIADGEVSGTVVVPPEATCSLIRTTVDGNVVIGAEGSLYASNTSIRGSVSANALGDLVLNNGTTVGGSVSLTGGTASIAITDGDTPTVIGGRLLITDLTIVAVTLIIEGVDVRGGVTVADNDLEEGGNIAGTTVGGSLSLRDNRGSVAVSDNQIRGSLQCTGNVPPPVVGSNTVAGRRGGQCAGPAMGAA